MGMTRIFIAHGHCVSVVDRDVLNEPHPWLLTCMISLRPTEKMRVLQNSFQSLHPFSGAHDYLHRKLYPSRSSLSIVHIHSCKGEQYLADNPDFVGFQLLCSQARVNVHTGFSDKGRGLYYETGGVFVDSIGWMYVSDKVGCALPSSLSL